MGTIDHNLIRSEIAAKKCMVNEQKENKKDTEVRHAFLQRMRYMLVKIKQAKRWDKRTESHKH